MSRVSEFVLQRLQIFFSFSYIEDGGGGGGGGTRGDGGGGGGGVGGFSDLVSELF